MLFSHFAKPLSRFFRSAPPAPSPAENPAAPAIPPTAPEPESKELIIATALGDGEDSARAFAQRRMAQLIDAGEIDFATVDDPKRVAGLVTQGSSSRLRQLAAHSIQDPTELKQLLKHLRGKDKTVYKIIKQKCDVLRAEEQRVAQIERDVTALCASLERHSHRIYDELYVPSFEQFDARWQALEPQATAEARDRVRPAIDRCREVVAAHARQLAERALEVSQQAARRAEREHAIALADEEAQHRSEIAARAAAEAAKSREAEATARTEKLAAEALALRRIGGLVAKAHGALREGNTGQAAGLRRAIEEKLPTAPAAPPSLARQVQQLDAKLDELREWKEHAVAPKRAELIEEMEALIGWSEEPKSLAERIKHLQEEWKTISKGIVSDSEADWQRFHQASIAAYQPCREYFEAQAKQRQENMQQRKNVLERLGAFEIAQSGEHPDWRSVSTVLREARQEWRRYSPVDRAAGVAVQQEFDASIARLQARLDAWHAQNAADKNALIQRAQRLLSQDSREAVEAVKDLQRQWKEVGAAHRDQEQRLWDEFRAQCDAVFHKRQQAHAEYAAGLEATKAQAMALCEEAEQIAALSGPALREGAGKIPQWRAAFEGLGALPRSDDRRLHDRFERALVLCQAKVSQDRARDVEQSFANLLEAARRIQFYGWVVARDGASAERDALKQSASMFIAGVEHWPKGGAQALKEAWVTADAAANLDAAAHETAFRTLCIRSEILTDRPTPTEDQALRREYQVKRLVQRMGQGNEGGADELDALACEWVRVGPVSTETHERLLTRFLGCRR